MLSVKEAQKKVLECSIRIKAVEVPLLDSLELIYRPLPHGIDILTGSDTECGQE